MDPGLRRRLSTRGGARPDEELKSNRKRVFVIGGALLLMLGVAGRISWHIPHDVPFNFDDHRHKGPVVTDADQLYRAYHADPDSAAKRFGGRELTVSGEFLRIVPDGYGSIDMRLKTSDPDSPLGIDLVGSAIDDAKQLRPGQQVTVSCREMGSGTDLLWVRDCAIQPTAQGSAPPAAPKSPSPPAATATPAG